MHGIYKRTVAPTATPITTAEAKTQCAIASGIEDHDDYIDALIDRATEAIEKHCNIQMLSATWTLVLDTFPTEIVIVKPPVTAISSIGYTDTSGTAQTLSASAYQTSLSTEFAPARIKPAVGYNWPNTQTDAYEAVTVTFTCGYAEAADVPLTLKHAVAFLVAHWFRNRESVADRTISKIPDGLEMLLSLEDWGAYA